MFDGLFGLEDERDEMGLSACRQGCIIEDGLEPPLLSNVDLRRCGMGANKFDFQMPLLRAHRQLNVERLNIDLFDCR